MDIVPTLWQEGTGVDNLVIRGNTFEMADKGGNPQIQHDAGIARRSFLRCPVRGDFRHIYSRKPDDGGRFHA